MNTTRDLNACRDLPPEDSMAQASAFPCSLTTASIGSRTSPAKIT